MKLCSILNIFFLICTFAASVFAADERPPELWKTYMHGIKPDNAVKLAVADIVKLNPGSEKYISSKDTIEGEPAFKIKRNTDLTVTLPIDIEAMKGKKMRLFYWCKAVKVGYGNGWHAPWLVLIARNSAKKTLISYPAWFHTEGTYPWHCYYVEIFIPKAAAEFAVHFYTPNGLAYFSGFSYEEVTKANTYSNDYKQCPATGSLAPNIYYDQMPEHMTRGYGNKYPYRWMLGSKVGLVGQPDDITTLSGFTNYFKTKGIKKPEHINHGLLHLADAYRRGKKLGLLPPIEDGWLDNFRDLLLEAQDPVTGYWHDGKTLSMGATFHILNMHFRYYELARSDRPDIIKPGFALTQTVPRADEIISQTLKQQSSWVDPQGKTRKAGWNNAAYTYTLTPDKGKSRFAMGSTWDAVYLLRLAGRFAKDNERRKEIYNAVKDAYYYFTCKMVMPDGNIRLVNTSDNVSNSYAGVLWQDFYALERRVFKDLPASKGCVKFENGKAAVSAEIADGMDAVRVYVAPQSVTPEKLNERYLVGVIHKKGENNCELDPFVLFSKCNEAALQRFGRRLYTDKWPKGSYLRHKFSMVKLPLKYTVNCEPLIFNADLEGKNVFISSSNWHGEESVPVMIGK